VRAHIAAAAALGRAGRVEDALPAIRSATAEAESTRHRPVIAEALLEHGRIAMSMADHEGATPLLRRAMKEALASEQIGLAVEAAARRIYTEAVQSADLERLGRDLDYVESMSRSLVGDHFVRPLLLNNVGAAYMAAKQPDEALRYFQLARDAVAGHAVDLELTAIDQNLAMLTPIAAERAARSRGAWLRLQAALGEHHLATLQALVSHALFSADAETAYQLITRACAGYDRMHPRLLDRRARCESERGLLASELELPDVARTALTAAIAAATPSSDPDLVALRGLAEGELALLNEDPARASAAFAAVIELRRASTQWWEERDAYRAELGLGLALVAAGRRSAARRHFDAAAAGFAEVTRLNPSLSYRLLLAKARAASALSQPEVRNESLSRVTR
jgi:tetratricopeptide (TPR) repeat protein